MNQSKSPAKIEPKAELKSPEPKTEAKQRDPIKEISIEVCQNCGSHKWCTRHNEAKYNGLFEEVKAAVTAAIGGEIQVVKNLNIKKARIGAFEVVCNGIVIFSKIKSSLFPVPSALAQRIKLFVADYNSGNDVSKYSSIDEKKYSPPKKKITQTSLDWNVKYEELKKSQKVKKQDGGSVGGEGEREATKEQENNAEGEKPKTNQVNENQNEQEIKEQVEKKEYEKKPSQVNPTEEGNGGLKEVEGAHE